MLSLRETSLIPENTLKLRLEQTKSAKPRDLCKSVAGNFYVKTLELLNRFKFFMYFSYQS